MADDAKKGLEEAHTRPDLPEIVANVEDAELAAAVHSLRNDLEREPDQLDLIAEDIEPIDTLEKIAELSQVDRRARERGRPKGALNKRNDKVFDYLEACGHRDPATTLSLLQSADTLSLAQALHMKPKEVLAEQIRAAAVLMGYKYAKKPVDLNVNDKRQRPIMIIGQMNNTQIKVGDDGIRSAGQPRSQDVENITEIEGESLRQDSE